MFGKIGVPELLIILLLVLVLFGAKRVPELARSLGRSILEFKKGLESVEKKPDPPKNDGA